MKYSIALVATAVFVAAQSEADIPACGQLCINNMRGQFASFGCSGPTDVGCLCSNAAFGYGLRDCSQEACGAEVNQQVVAYAQSICAAVGVTTGGAGAGAAASSGAAAISQSQVPFTTSDILTTISSDGSAVATSTIGQTTLFSVASGLAGSLSGSASEAAASASGAFSSAAADASGAAESASGAASSAAGSASDALTSATGAAGSAASSAAGAASSAADSATSTGMAPVMTAAPILGGAALAALLML